MTYLSHVLFKLLIIRLDKLFCENWFSVSIVPKSTFIRKQLNRIPSRPYYNSYLSSEVTAMNELLICKI